MKKNALIYGLAALTLLLAAVLCIACSDKSIHTVVFDDGTFVRRLEVEDGLNILPPSEPHRDGYDFLYWAKEDGTKFDFAEKIVSDLTLRAVWQAVEAETVEITFDYNYEGAIPKKIEVEKGAEVAEPLAPFRQGYAFLGWRDSSGHIVDFAAFRAEKEEVFYAVWSKTSAAYKVSFYSDGIYFEAEYSEGERITAPNAPQRDGYVFLGWGDAAGKVVNLDDYIVNSDLSFYALWEKEKARYTVTFYDFDGKVFAVEEFVEGETLRFPQKTPTAPEFYVFDGWKAESEVVLGETSVYPEMRLDSADEKYFRAEAVDGGVYLSGVVGLVGIKRLILPETIGGKTVLGIKDADDETSGVFYGCDIEELYIPSSYKYVGDYAFAANRALSRIVLGEGVAELGDYAFAPAKDFGRAASVVKNIVFPSSITEIGEYCFYMAGCSLGAAELDIEFKDDSALRKVGAHSFEGAKIKNLRLPNCAVGVKTELSEYCFASAFHLEKIELSAAVSEIGDYAFYRAGGVAGDDYYSAAITDKFKKVALNIPNENSLVKVGNRAFDGVRLSGVLRAPQLSAVGEYAFKGHELSEIYSEQLKIIGDYAFYGRIVKSPDTTAATIKRFQVGDKLEKLGKFALYNEVGVTSISLVAIKDIEVMALSGTGLKSAAIPQGAKVAAQAFYNCPNLEKLVYASDCDIPAYCFAACEKLAEITVGGAVKRIGEGAFLRSGADSASLKITLPSAVTELGVRAFFRAGASEIDLSACVSLKNISEYCFAESECVAIKLPSSLEKLGAFAFDGCVKAERVSFGSADSPSRIKEIGSEAFRGNNALREVYLYGVTEPPAILGAADRRIFSGYKVSSTGEYIRNETTELSALKIYVVASALTKFQDKSYRPYGGENVWAAHHSSQIFAI